MLVVTLLYRYIGGWGRLSQKNEFCLLFEHFLRNLPQICFKINFSIMFTFPNNRISILYHSFVIIAKIKRVVKLTQPAPPWGRLSHPLGHLESILDKEGKL